MYSADCLLLPELLPTKPSGLTIWAFIYVKIFPFTTSACPLTMSEQSPRLLRARAQKNVGHICIPRALDSDASMIGIWPLYYWNPQSSSDKPWYSFHRDLLHKVADISTVSPSDGAVGNIKASLNSLLQEVRTLEERIQNLSISDSGSLNVYPLTGLRQKGDDQMLKSKVNNTGNLLIVWLVTV